MGIGGLLLIVLLLIVLLLLVLFGNPWMGPRVYQDYNHGYWPSGIGLILAIPLILWLFGRFR